MYRLLVPPTAIICGSTLTASGALKAAKDTGLDVPGALSIMAHDDGLPQAIAANFAPPLTVTSAPLHKACQPLADALIDHIAGASAAGLQQLVHAELVVRQSTTQVAPGEGQAWRLA